MEEILKNIQGLRKGFICEYGISPTHVYLGNEEFYTLKATNEFLIQNFNITDDPRVFGMKVIRVSKDNYISVGIVVE